MIANKARQLPRRENYPSQRCKFGRIGASTTLLLVLVDLGFNDRFDFFAERRMVLRAPLFDDLAFQRQVFYNAARRPYDPDRTNLDIWRRYPNNPPIVETMFPYSVLAQSSSTDAIIGLLPILLLVLVIVMLVWRRRSDRAGRGMQDAHGVNLATLFTPRNESNTFSSAERLRDDACPRLVARAKSAGWEVIEQRSQAHSPSVWFRLDYLLPSPTPDVSLCASVAVDIERFDFHRFEHTFTVIVQVGTGITKIRGLIALDDKAVGRIHEHIAVHGRKLRLRNCVRLQPWQLWRPLNTVQRLHRDWTNVILTIIAIVSLVIPFVGWFVTIGIVVALRVRKRRRRTYVLTSGKPMNDPRKLRWMDSWQVSIGQLGPQGSTVRDGIIRRLEGGGPEGATVGAERIGYWGTDSWVEREQIVVRHRRALGFVHVVEYGDVLYVAWEAHLNIASWNEETLATGIDRISKLPVVANRVVAGSFQLNEYDVSDSNFLAEWMHEAVKREVKLRMAEQKIDQEIDFTVQRESRKDALDTPNTTEPAKDRVKKRFKRLA